MKKASVDVDRNIKINIKVDKDASFSAEEIEQLIEGYLKLSDEEDRDVVRRCAFLLDKLKLHNDRNAEKLVREDRENKNTK